LKAKSCRFSQETALPVWKSSGDWKLSTTRLTTIAFFAASLLAGCGGSSSDLKLLPVKGSVAKDGKALVGVKVLLETSDPKLKAPMLYGISDDEGAFEIQTSAGDKGAPAGLYKVVLAPPASGATFDYAKPGKGPKANTDLVPKNLQSASTTELSYEVKSSSGPLDIKVP